MIVGVPRQMDKSSNKPSLWQMLNFYLPSVCEYYCLPASQPPQDHADRDASLWRVFESSQVMPQEWPHLLQAQGVWLSIQWRYQYHGTTTATTSGVHLLISHQTGTSISTVSAHIIESTAVIKLWLATQIASEQTPTFQDWNMLLDIEASTRMHARKLTKGTRGYVESMLRIASYLGGLYMQMSCYRLTSYCCTCFVQSNFFVHQIKDSQMIFADHDLFRCKAWSS